MRRQAKQTAGQRSSCLAPCRQCKAGSHGAVQRSPATCCPAALLPPLRCHPLSAPGWRSVYPAACSSVRRLAFSSVAAGQGGHRVGAAGRSHVRWAAVVHCLVPPSGCGMLGAADKPIGNHTQTRSTAHLAALRAACRPCHSPAGGCRHWLPVGSPLVTQINMTSAAVSAAATAAAVAAGAAAFACKKVDLAVSWT